MLISAFSFPLIIPILCRPWIMLSRSNSESHVVLRYVNFLLVPSITVFTIEELLPYLRSFYLIPIYAINNIVSNT